MEFRYVDTTATFVERAKVRLAVAIEEAAIGSSASDISDAVEYLVLAMLEDAKSKGVLR